MNGQTRLYFKLFFYSGLSFGLAMGILWSMEYGFLYGLGRAIISGPLFGGFMSLIIGGLHISSVRKIAGELDESTFDVIQENEIELRLPYNKALNLCVESISKIKNGLIVDVDPIKGLTNAKSKMSWRTFGDIIELRIKLISDDLVRVGISSRPILRTTLVDYGSNLENVQRVTSFLEMGISRLAPGNQSFEARKELPHINA